MIKRRPISPGDQQSAINSRPYLHHHLQINESDFATLLKGNINAMKCVLALVDRDAADGSFCFQPLMLGFTNTSYGTEI